MKKNLWNCMIHPRPAARVLVLPLLSASVLLAACGGGKSGSNTYAAQAVAETAAASMDATAVYYDGGYDMEAAYDNFAAETAAEMEEGSAGLTQANPINPAAVTGRKLIRNVYMTVETDAFDDLLVQLQNKVTELAGYIEQSDVSGASITYDNVRPNRYASLTARIPSDKLDHFIATVEGNGNVTNKSESTQDITLQYSDLESRKKTLTVEQDRIWSLLEKADTLESVIALEERLSEIRYELESMESRLKLFDNQVQYSTIDISIHEVMPAHFTPVAPETVGQRIKKGFSKNVNGLVELATDLLILLIAGSPIWIPLAAIAALIFILVRRSLKKKQESFRPVTKTPPVFFQSTPPATTPTTQTPKDQEPLP